MLKAGINTVMRRPTVFLVEVAWRWAFAAVALPIVFTGLQALLSTSPLDEPERTAFGSLDFFRASVAALHFLRSLRGRPLGFALLIAFAVSLFWLLLSSAGRALTLGKLAGRKVQFGPIVVRQLWRVIYAWGGLAALAAILNFAVRIAMAGRSPDYVIFVVMLLPLSVSVFIFWSLMNWYFSLGTVCIAAYDAKQTSTGRQTMFFLSQHWREALGISLLSAVFRLLLVLLIVVLIAIPSGYLSGESRWMWPIELILGYCLVADFLYVSRLAAYLALETARGVRSSFLKTPLSRFRRPTNPKTLAAL